MKINVEEEQRRIEVANKVLSTFNRSQFFHAPRGWYVRWIRHDGALETRRWQCRGQDFYPVWSHEFPGGGTAMTAISQLIRWCAGRPVLPIATWQYWASDTVKLLPNATVGKLIDGGYPVHVKCVLCHETIVGGLDWWHLGKVSGPCCGFRNGCRQKGKS